MFKSIKINTLPTIVALLFLALSTPSCAVSQDSVGAITKDGKKYTVHEVEKKETLYAISKKYDVTVDNIKAWNNLADNNIDKGQKLNILIGDVPSIKIVNKKTPPITHTVSAGETLYAISRKYNKTVDEIKNNNNLTSNALDIGQILIIEKGNTTTAKNPVVKIETPTNEKKVVENGKAVLMDREDYDVKFAYCLHKTAPVGTIIKITNTISGKFIYGKVMGSFTSEDDTLIQVNKTIQSTIGNDLDNVSLLYVY